MRRPARGLLLIKKPEVTTQPGRVILLDKTVGNWTQGQAEVLAVGAPAIPEEDEEIEPLDPRVVVGAWVLTRFRRWVATDVPGEFLVKHDDVLGVFDVSR